MRLLGGLSPNRFLADYWQKRPLLVRDAWLDFSDPLSPEEVAGLACEEGVSARLVLEHGDSPWQLRQGPLVEADFLGLPADHWMLLVSDVEKHLPELAELLEPFRFVPDWRIDDLQISYAPQHGSAGPHWDDYDVFLLQGLGRKRWRLSRAPVAADNFRDDTALRILRHFQPDEELTLGPGDLLYLPPRLAHHGVAVEPSLTYSIGFRAPSQQDLLASFTDHLLARSDATARYADPDLRPADNPGAIDDAVLNRVERLLRQALQWNRGELGDWLGRYLSEPKPDYEPEPREPPLNCAALIRALRAGSHIHRHPGSRLLYYANSDGSLDLFADGQRFELAGGLAWLGKRLCRQRFYTASELRPGLEHPAAVTLLLELFNCGSLLLAED